MKIAIANDSGQTIGGGWSFISNLTKGLRKAGVDIVSISDADIVLIASTSMVKKETVAEIKDKNKKLVIRIDNVPRNSRNRNTGTSRLKSFSQAADAIVYQSNWARSYLFDFIGREGKTIYNGVDTEIFNENDRAKTSGSVYLYSRFNRDETKNWELAWYKYQLIQRKDVHARLLIVGQFSPEQIEYNFDFFRGESFEYLGIIDKPENMADIYRTCDYLLATYYNDCYSNTYQEALACGCQLFEPDMSGGTPELIKNGVISLEKMTENYLQLFREVIG